MEAIILAGGLGTRLRKVITDLPKPMAPIGGRPFIAILFDELIAAGFTSAILAVGYRHEMILDYFGDNYRSLQLIYSVERKPLGTGGAIRLAIDEATASEVFVLNGDTHLELDYRAMLSAHLSLKSSITIAVRVVPDVSRYGSLDIAQSRIRGFSKKEDRDLARSTAGSISFQENCLRSMTCRPSFLLKQTF